MTAVLTEQTDRPPETVQPALRGQLTIHPRVAERIAERSAAEVTGRSDRPSGWRLMGGGGLPRASATVVGRHVQLAVTVAAGADRALPDVAGAVRDQVAHTVQELTGLQVDEVDVHIAALSGTPAPDTPPLPAAAPPRGAGPARRAGMLLALVLLVLGGLAGYDALVSAGAVDGPELTRGLLDRLDGLRPQDWMIPAGIVAALIGLWLIVSALRPRPVRSLPLRAGTGVYASRSAVESVAEDTATRHPGVVAASARARAKSIVVRLRTDGEDETAGEVRTELVTRLDRLAGPPEIRVPARSAGGES